MEWLTTNLWLGMVDITRWPTLIAETRPPRLWIKTKVVALGECCDRDSLVSRVRRWAGQDQPGGQIDWLITADHRKSRPQQQNHAKSMKLMWFHNKFNWWIEVKPPVDHRIWSPISCGTKRQWQPWSIPHPRAPKRDDRMVLTTMGDFELLGGFFHRAKTHQLISKICHIQK